MRMKRHPPLEAGTCHLNRLCETQMQAARFPGLLHVQIVIVTNNGQWQIPIGAVNTKA